MSKTTDTPVTLVSAPPPGDKVTPCPRPHHLLLVGERCPTCRERPTAPASEPTTATAFPGRDDFRYMQDLERENAEQRARLASLEATLAEREQDAARLEWYVTMPYAHEQIKKQTAVWRAWLSAMGGVGGIATLDSIRAAIDAARTPPADGREDA